MLAIYKKEIKAYFNSIIGWLFLAFFLAFTGLYVYVNNFLQGYAFIGYALNSITLVFALLVPLVTMRIMAEENRQKTDQLLLTSPVPIWKIVCGKYLALVTLIAMAMLVVCVYPVIFTKFGVVNLPMSYGAIFGFFLIGCAYLSVGLFISTLTESQAFAAVMTFIVVLLTTLAGEIAKVIPDTAKVAWMTYSVVLVLLAVWLWRVMKNMPIVVTLFVVCESILTVIYVVKAELLEGTVEKLLGSFAILRVYEQTISGVLELRMPVYYLSIAFVFCYFTYQTIRKRRYS